MKHMKVPPNKFAASLECTRLISENKPLALSAYERKWLYCGTILIAIL